MEGLIIPLIGLVGFLLLAGPIAFFKIIGANDRIRALNARIAKLDERLARLEDREIGPAPTPVLRPGPEPEPVTAPSAAPVPTPPIEEPEPEPIAARVAEPPPPPDMERALADRWLVWLGGLVLALGGVFLVKYSIDQGLLGPAVRVTLGVLLGAGLVVAGHRIGGRAEGFTRAGIAPAAVPPALVGAGIAVAFASLYAAFALHHLIGPLPAFLALAGLAGAAMLLAIRHGPFVALLGLVGAYAVPALVSTGHPDGAILFSYLFFVTAAIAALLRWKDWLWLAWAALIGALGWVVIWWVDQGNQDAGLIHVYLLALLVLAFALRRGVPWVPALTGVIEGPHIKRIIWASAAAVGVTAALYLDDLGSREPALRFGLGFAILILGFARRDQVFDALPVLPGLMALLILVAASPDRLGPDGIVTRAVWLAAPFLVGGFIALWGARRPGRWAALSTAMPILLMAESFGILEPEAPATLWALAAAGLAAVFLFGAERAARYRADPDRGPGFEAALGAYAVGVVAAVTLACAFLLREAWLTAALAVQTPAIAWINGQVKAKGLAPTAILLALAVLVRLTFNPSLLEYGDGSLWAFYGYGVPLVSFAFATRTFRAQGAGLAADVLEAGAIACAALLISVEIRDWAAGGLGAPLDDDLVEIGLHAAAWLGIGLGAFELHRRTGRTVPLWAGWILWGAAGLAELAGALFTNPWLDHIDIGVHPVFDFLLLAYLMPAFLYGLHAWRAPPPERLRGWSGGLALLLGFVWLTGETRHGFTGRWIDGAAPSNGELYALSVAWLLYGVAILASGIRFAVPALRRTGLGLILLVVAKAFFVDMSALRGLWRAMSFLGLGGVLVGLGWLYRRLESRVGQPPA